MAEPYDSIFASIVAETNRPDLVAEINVGIANALVFFHGLDFWPYDVVRVAPAYTIEDGIVIIVKADELPRYKKLVENLDACGRTVTGVFINGQCYPARNTTGSFSTRRCEIGFYEDANNITIVTGLDDNYINTLEIEYYQHPLLNPLVDLESWIASQYPQYVISFGVKHVQGLIGNSKQSVVTDKEVVAFTNNLLSNHLSN